MILTIANNTENICGCRFFESVREIRLSGKNICNFLSPVVDVAFKMQQEFGSVSLKEVETTASGLWQSSIYANPKRGIYYIEEAYIYILCKVPIKSRNNNRKTDYERIFLI